MTNVVLGILDIFQKVFTSLGVNYDQLRSIVEAKLTMDNRRHVIGYARRQTTTPQNTFFTTFLIYMLFGCFPALMIISFPSMTLSLMFFFSYLMMMITMTLVTDFSSVLLDTSDNTILLPRPVDSRTVFAARIVHISAYLAQLTFGLSVAPLLAMAISYKPIVLLVFIAGILLSVVFALCLTNAVYLLVLRFASEEKIRNIINYLQIGMTITVVGAYQLGPRMIARLDGQSFAIDRWSLLIPPAWMTGMVEAVQTQSWDGLHSGLSILALCVPIAGLYMVNRYLSPAFSRKLALVGAAGRRRLTRRPGGKGVPLSRRLSRLMTTSHIEQSAFELVYALVGRDRKIKLKTYPAIGYLLVFAALFVIRGPNAFGAGQYYHLAMVYMIVLVLQMVIHEVSYSDEFRASWIFFAAPVARPGDILAGTFKAVFVRFFLPGYTFCTAIVLFIWGVSVNIAIDLAAGFLNICILLLAFLILKDHYMPFSLSPAMRTQSGRFARMLFLTVPMFGLVFIHYNLAKWPMVLAAAVPFQIVIVIVLTRLYRSVEWKDVKQ